MKLLSSDKEKVIAYRNATVATALRAGHLEMASQQIGAILLLAGARILECSHAARATIV